MSSTDGVVIGNPHDACRAVNGLVIDCSCGCDEPDNRLYLNGAGDDDPRLSKRIIGEGESRTAWLINGVVYKVGRDSANTYEHEALTAWHAAGAPWAPITSLYQINMTLDVGYVETYVVIAMPYLPDDGSQVDEAALTQLRSVASQTWRGNYTVRAGQPWLIDGVDVDYLPPSSLAS